MFKLMFKRERKLFLGDFIEQIFFLGGGGCLDGWLGVLFVFICLFLCFVLFFSFNIGLCSDTSKSNFSDLM